MPRDQVIWDAQASLAAEARHFGAFTATGPKYGLEIVYRLLHDDWPALIDSDIRPRSAVCCSTTASRWGTSPIARSPSPTCWPAARSLGRLGGRPYTGSWLSSQGSVEHTLTERLPFFGGIA